METFEYAVARSLGAYPIYSETTRQVNRRTPFFRYYGPGTTPPGYRWPGCYNGGPDLLVRKTVEVVLGFLLIVVGLIMAIPGVPGPGLAVVVLGLVLLSAHYHWARRTLEWAKGRLDRLRGKKRQ